MTKRFTFGIILFILAFSVGDAFTRDFLPADGKWWQLENLARRIDLTSGEIDRLDQAFLESRRKMIQLKTDLEKEQFELEALVDRPELDESAALSQYDKLETARRTLGLERFRFLLSVRKIIGFEKFQKLLMLKHERERRRDH